MNFSLAFCNIGEIKVPKVGGKLKASEFSTTLEAKITWWKFRAQIIHTQNHKTLTNIKSCQTLVKADKKSTEFECEWVLGSRGSLIGWKGEKNIHYYYCYHHQPQEGSP